MNLTVPRISPILACALAVFVWSLAVGDFTIAPGSPGAPATITWRPQTDFFAFVNRTTTTPAGTRSTLSGARARLSYSSTSMLIGKAPTWTMRPR